MLNSDQHRSALQVGLGVASPLWPAFAFAASTGAAFWWLSQMSFGRWRPAPYNVEALQRAPAAAAETALVIVERELEVASAAVAPVIATEAKPATETVAEILPAKAMVQVVEEQLEAAPAPAKAAPEPVTSAQAPAKIEPAPLAPAPVTAAREPIKAAAAPAKPVAESVEADPGSASSTTSDARILAKTEAAAKTAPAAEKAPATKAEAAAKPAAITPPAPVAKALMSAKPTAAAKAVSKSPSAKPKPTTARS